jgi:hypothetical protein
MIKETQAGTRMAGVVRGRRVSRSESRDRRFRIGVLVWLSLVLAFLLAQREQLSERWL